MKNYVINNNETNKQVKCPICGKKVIANFNNIRSWKKSKDNKIVQKFNLLGEKYDALKNVLLCSNDCKDEWEKQFIVDYCNGRPIYFIGGYYSDSIEWITRYFDTKEECIDYMSLLPAL